jgi:hypothetical protein
MGAAGCVRALTHAAASLAVLALAACTVAESYRVSLAGGELNYALPASNCASEAGAYSLSATTWKFEILRFGSGPFVMNGLTEQSHTDSRFTYCLDYLASVLADDKLSIGYATATTGSAAGTTGLLSYVASFSVDRSADIARDLIRTIFVAISGNPNFGANRFSGNAQNVDPVTHGKFELDPLDPEEMAAVNNQIKSFGFCLVLDDYTFDTDAVSAGAYCSNPFAVSRKHPSPDVAELRGQRWLKPAAERGGILYRPRLPYTLSVYTKEDPRGPGAWALRKTTVVELENLSPIVSLGLNRAVFAESRVGLEFDKGVLSNFCVAKTSEVAGFIDVPLDIVYGLVSLPSETIKAEINRAGASKELVEAETALISAQRQFIAFQKDKGAKTNAVAGANSAVINGKTGCPSGGCIPASDATAFPKAVALRQESGKFLGNVCGSIATSVGAVAASRLP